MVIIELLIVASVDIVAVEGEGPVEPGSRGRVDIGGEAQLNNICVSKEVFMPKVRWKCISRSL